MKRLVITGASGFIGANLTRRLLSAGHEVHVLLRPQYHPWRLEAIKKDIRPHIINLADAESLSRLLAEIKPDWIFHTAAYGAYSSQMNFRQMTETNLVSTANLVDAAVKVGFETFINTGSSSEYGYKDHAPSEEESLEPNSSYAVTKAAAAHYCRHIAISQQVNLITLRLYSVYGPYEEPTRLMPTLVMEGLSGKLPPLVNPEIARDFIYVDDVSEAYLKAAAHLTGSYGEIFNIGSGIQVKLHELVDIVRRQMEIKAQPAWGSMPDRGWDTSTWVANIEHSRQCLAWQPKVPLSGGINQFVEWMKTDPNRLAYYQSNRALPV